MSGERARLFVALELPPDVRDALARWAEPAVARLGSLRPVSAESLHVTLCFLGSLPVSEIAPIAASLSGAFAPAASLSLSLGAATWLPRRRPNVLAIRVEDPAAALAAVQSGLSAALERGGWYEPESRPFLAHVTIARVARGVRVRPVSLASPPPVSFRGAAVTLFRSRTEPGGARYEPLSRLAL